jgi:predicted DNA-binding transcriptional regulator AlpA
MQAMLSIDEPHRRSSHDAQASRIGYWEIDDPPCGHRVASWAPRFLRLRQAALYLGMNKNSFNSLVRPAITTISIGKRAIAFDRLELDAWAESYCRCNGR